MLSDLQQRRVWEGQLAAEIRASYFADLSNRYQRIQRLVTWAILVSSSGAAATLLADGNLQIFVWVKPVLTLVTAALSLWSLVENYNRKATDASDLQFRYRNLAREFEALWDDMYAAGAKAELDRLTVKTAELEKSSTPFPNNEKRMKKWQDHVERLHRLSPAA